MNTLDLSFLGEKWPSGIVARTSIKEFTGGMISEKTMANLDSNGEGPDRFTIGRKVAYKVDVLIAWLEQRSIVNGSEEI